MQNQNITNNFFLRFQVVASKVRLSLMDFDQLSNEIQPCPIFDSNQLLNAFRDKTTSKNIRYRGALCT